MDLLEVFDSLSKVGGGALGVAGLVLVLILRAREKGVKIRDLLASAGERALKVVRATEQTVRREVKAALSDGKLDTSEKKKIKEAAVEALKDEFGEGALKLLAEHLGDSKRVDRYLDREIEAAVYRLKKAA